jgi:F-type H+-transporting ATPase subunit b
MIKLILTLVVFLNISLFANSGAGETDIMARSINFIIFAMILYYLIANPAKEFLTARSDGIKGRLQEVQTKLQETKKSKEDAKNTLYEAEKFAEEIVSTAKKDSLMISDKYEKQTAEHIKNLDKHTSEIQEIEIRVAKKEVVAEVMDEVFDDTSISITQEEIAQKLLKKVA